MSNNQNQGGVSPSAGYAGGMPTGGQTGRTPRQPPPRFITGASPGGGGGQGYYTGTGLVGRNNTVALPEPYPEDEQFFRNVYSSMSPQDKARTFDILRRKGLYTGSSNFENDLQAIGNWIVFSNDQGVTRDRALFDMDRFIPDREGTGGGVRRYRVSNPDDVKNAVNKAALDTIGRAFTEQELALVVPGFQQAELKSQQAYYGGGVSAEAPSTQAFGQAAAQFLAPTEANGFKFMRIMNRIFNATGGM
jgi:hypothetical protein